MAQASTKRRTDTSLTPIRLRDKEGDRNFLQYRGFLHLHSRALSALQADIVALEKELDRMDQWDMQCELPNRLKCLKHKRRDDFDSVMSKMPQDYTVEFERTRPEILEVLRGKLVEYDELLMKTRDVHALQKPAQRDYDSVRNWFDSKKPLVHEDMEYVWRKEDLITLRAGRESAGFDGLVERCLNGVDKFLRTWCRCRIIQRLFVTEELRQKTDNILIHYYAPHRVDILVNLIITAIIFILLVVPVVIMYTGQNASTSPVEAIGILIVFTLLFGCAMSALTTAKRQELFAASAAYCAVLVVFVGNLGVQQVQIVPA
ncbi:hypothetical protein LTR53_009278 [Teratosphaeriaceae sp. CCFEE 6253]|nr:hypothetical protein LTR53_009278 [Teratosphaeriaceae sp. CCFEE 6253]